MIPVLIPCGNRRNVAARALATEGVDFKAVVMEDTVSYAQLLTDAWHAGLGMIVVEDDIAPWPGALQQLQDCQEPWCGFDYSIGFGRFGLGTLGCFKVSAQLMLDFPDTPVWWGDTHWHQLDAKVIRALRDITGRPRFHEHGPPVAHAQHYR